ncbi:uncharacterized protein [Venturia canescens]|uniref:uncharacterized protein n=1 Tax=Venturia canescens TaxID=32260 RepID=UPI001C9C649E|nr:uncharacterized protein LOC122412959 [Venturia canescens]
MAHLRDTFTSVSHSHFTWPYPMPVLVKPSQPPRRTGNRLYEKISAPDDCDCEAQDFQRDIARYKQLAEKERQMQNEVYQMNCEMSDLVSSLVDKYNLDDAVMKSVYQIDYEKRGIPIAKYRPLMAAVDSPVGSPIQPVVTELRDGCREPSRFRYSAIERPTIQPATPVNFQRIPESCFTWEEPVMGQSEYVNGTSKLADINMKSRQQYLEPRPSSRRRRGGP